MESIIYQGMTLRILRTCPPPQKVYIILNSISICQKMNLSTGQVADKIYLSGWKFYLSQTTGQPLMSHPVNSCMCARTQICMHAHDGGRNIFVSTNFILTILHPWQVVQETIQITTRMKMMCERHRSACHR